MAVDPRGIDSFIEWSDYMVPDLEEYGAIGRVFREEDWQDWGAGLLSLSGIATLGIPSPYEFSDWKDWAFRFIDLLNQGS